VRICPPRSPSSRLIVVVITGRLVFATTNHIERIDPVLSRPGRMDIWVNFTNATKLQAECIFKGFFPTRPPMSSHDEASFIDTSSKNPPVHGEPILEEAEISQLARRFADAIPEGEMSVWPELRSRSWVISYK
jgi:mitochondrial chaperone BCS1